MFRFLKLVFLPVIAIVATGCTHITAVYRPASYEAREPKIDQPIRLIISNDVKASVSDGHYLWDTYRVPSGKILETNAPKALGSVFQRVLMGDDGSDSAYSVILTINPATEVDLGAFTFSENRFKSVLQCDIKSASGATVWSKIITSEAGGRRVAQALAATGGGLIGASFALADSLSKKPERTALYPGSYIDPFTAALQDAANESVAGGLRRLADEIHDAREMIFQRSDPPAPQIIGKSNNF